MSTETKCRAEKYHVPEGYQVFQWPEFQAFAKRLSVDLEAAITKITIDIPIDQFVRVTIESNGLDEQKPIKSDVERFLEASKGFERVEKRL